MKTALMATLILTAAACQSAPPDKLSPNAGYPDVAAGATPEPASGELVVYTIATSAGQMSRPYTPEPGKPQWRVYSGYTVYNHDGTRIGYIRNHTPYPSSDEAPSAVLLAPGRYLIRTDLPTDTPQTFWVTIESGKETRVDAMNLPKAPPEEPKVSP